ncbi:MAG TPA: hypothetical protein VKC55_05375, partial [Actinomycetota bacterium]|nr:hypothetical protein [Actinomycetota bacterium]
MKPTKQRGEGEAADAGSRAHGPRSWIVRYKPDLSIRFFSSATDADRARRPTDVILFVLSGVGLGLVSLFAPDRTAIDATTSRIVDALPGLFGWFWEIAHDLLILWPFVLLVASVVARHRLFLLRDQVLGGAFALAVLTLVSGGWSAMVDGLTGSNPPPVYPAVRVAIATALIVTTSPHLGRPVRRLGRWVIGVGALAGIALGIALPLGVIAGFAIGIGSAALVHLVFGSPGGLPSLDQVRAALEELGVEVSNLRQAELQPRGVALLRGEGGGGRPMLVKVYGRDAWDGQLLTSTWEYLWYRDESPNVTLSRRQQVEHEAFVTLLAERS